MVYNEEEVIKMLGNEERKLLVDAYEKGYKTKDL